MQPKTKARVRSIATTLLEVVSVAAITVGVWLIYPPAAFMFAGIAGVGASFLIIRGGAS